MSEALIQYDIIILGNTKTGKKTLRDFLASISPQESLQQGGSSRISMMKRKYQLNQDVTFSVRYWVNRGDFRTYSNFIKTIENVKGVVVLVDLSDRKSIQKIENYFISFQRRNLPIFLVGNKCDLDRQVSSKEMMNITQRFNAQYYEVSLLTGEMADELYQGILLSTLKENYTKGSCGTYVKNVRELQHQKKRALAYRYALEQVYGNTIRKDILRQSLSNIVPQQILQGDTDQDGYSREAQQIQQQIQGSLFAGNFNDQQDQGLFQNFLSKNSLMTDLSSSVIQHIAFNPQQIDVLN
ncbi:hypothetical protein ABPG72_006285 [Tetrahymena utriculariae]